MHISNSLLSRNNSKADVDEVAGHVYLYLKEQLELATPSLSYGLLHGTIIGALILNIPDAVMLRIIPLCSRLHDDASVLDRMLTLMLGDCRSVSGLREEE